MSQEQQQPPSVQEELKKTFRSLEEEMNYREVPQGERGAWVKNYLSSRISVLREEKPFANPPHVTVAQAKIASEEDKLSCRPLYGERIVIDASSAPTLASKEDKVVVQLLNGEWVLKKDETKPKPKLKRYRSSSKIPPNPISSTVRALPVVTLLDREEAFFFQDRHGSCASELEVDINKSGNALKIYSYRAVPNEILYTVKWSCPSRSFDFYLESRQSLTALELVDIIRPLVEKYTIYQTLFDCQPSSTN